MRSVVWLMVVMVIISGCTREKYRWDPNLARQQGYYQQPQRPYQAPPPMRRQVYSPQQGFPQGYVPSYQDNDAGYYLAPQAVQQPVPGDPRYQMPSSYDPVSGVFNDPSSYVHE